MNSTGFSGLAQGPPSVSSQNDRQTDKVKCDFKFNSQDFHSSIKYSILETIIFLFFKIIYSISVVGWQKSKQKTGSIKY